MNALTLAANAMRFIILIFSLFGSSEIYSQSRNDTIISKKFVDSLYTEIYSAKDWKNHFYWKSKLDNQLVHKDTVQIRVDSIDIEFRNSDHSLLCRESIIICLSGERSTFNKTFYNESAHPVYIEYWIGGCPSEFDTSDGYRHFWKMYKKERQVYGPDNRINRKIVHESFGYKRPETWIEEYVYSNNIVKVNRRRIFQYEFWN